MIQPIIIINVDMAYQDTFVTMTTQQQILRDELALGIMTPLKLAGKRADSAELGMIKTLTPRINAVSALLEVGIGFLETVLVMLGNKTHLHVLQKVAGR
jgi:hypothetical protein